jgi:hypothetical protein
MGRVFKTLWTEPAGSTTTTVDQRFYKETSYGELSFTKMRRFVVVRKRLHSCLCLAIYTYSGKGTAKNDVRPQDHAVVYVHGSEEPALLPDEQSKKGAFPIIIEEPGETIDPMSRLDFSRIYTVEHNVKVLKIGRISPDHHERLEKYFVESIVPPKDFLDFDPELSDSQIDSERLDSSFKTRKPKFFKTGRVFSIWNSEASGGELPGIRSFIVVAEGAQSCLCIRVQSYTKSFRRPAILLDETALAEHGLVYSSKVPKPVPFTNKKPLRVELPLPLSSGEIREPTLVHYAKRYTIDHDVRAKDFGSLDASSKKLIHEYCYEYTVSDQPVGTNDATNFITSIDDVLQASITIIQHISDVKDSSEACNKIRDEIESASYLLFMLKERIKQVEDEQADDAVERPWLTAFQPLGESGDLVEHFKGTQEFLLAKLDPKDAPHKVGTPLKWEFNEIEVINILESLARQKSRLRLALQNDPETKEYVVVD